jgi:hypothetical protein
MPIRFFETDTDRRCDISPGTKGRWHRAALSNVQKRVKHNNSNRQQVPVM